MKKAYISFLRVIYPDGTAERLITSGGDPFLGSYSHRFALVFGDPADLAGCGIATLRL